MTTGGWLGPWKAQARRLKQALRVLALAARDPRTPWPAKALALAVVAYGLSPIDLIPDPIPVLGLLDDLILLPLGVWLVIRMIPAEVWAACQEKAVAEAADDRAPSWAGAAMVVALWLVAGYVVFVWFWPRGG